MVGPQVSSFGGSKNRTMMCKRLTEHSPSTPQGHQGVEGCIPAPQLSFPHPRGGQNAQTPGGLSLQSLFFCFAGQEPINVLRVVLGVGLGLLILGLFGYAFVRWYQRSRCWHREYGESRAGKAPKRRAAGTGMWGPHVTFAGHWGQPHAGGSGAS